MKIYCGKCGGAYDDQFVVCPHCGNIREEQQEKIAVEEIKPEPPKNRKTTPKWVKITAVVVAVVIVLTGVLWSTGTLSNIMPVQAGYVRVPSVIGKSREKAKEILTKKKLGLLIIGKMDTGDDMELGLVCEQSPGKGDKAKENADVSVMLSNGPKMGYMPATVYYKVDTATANIEAQGLKAEVKYEYSDEVGKDGVISQSVETNTAVKQGETVTITVSKGSKNESEGTVKMKNLVGMDFETARKELLKDGIYLLVEDAKYDDNAPENQIIVQKDKEGAEIQKGENVFVTISLGKEKVRVPDLVYLEKAEAESKLKELGFIVKTETGSDENTADGLVLEQSAPSGEMLEKGSEITITVNDRPTTPSDGETASSPVDEYAKILEQYQEPENLNDVIQNNSDPIYSKYSVYDIDKNGTPELLIKVNSYDTNTYEYVGNYIVYSVQNGQAKKIGNFDGTRSTLFEDDDNGVIRRYLFNMNEMVQKVSLVDGKLSVKTIIDWRPEVEPFEYSDKIDEVETIDFSLLYEAMGDKGTDKALTKDEMKQLYIEANKMYAGWVDGMTAHICPDLNDRSIDNYHVIKPEGFSTIEELKAMLNNYFTRSVYDRPFFKEYYKELNGKIYAIDGFGQGLVTPTSTLKMTVVSANNSSCVFMIQQVAGPYDQSNDEFSLYKIDGKWIFTKNFNACWDLYLESEYLTWID